MTLFDLSLNGQRLQTSAQTLQDLLLAQGYEPQSAIACAVNSSFVPRAQWPDRQLQPGDRIDVITPIAGG